MYSVVSTNISCIVLPTIQKYNYRKRTIFEKYFLLDHQISILCKGNDFFYDFKYSFVLNCFRNILMQK